MPQLSLYEQIKQGLIKVDKKSSAEMRFWRNTDKNGPVHPIHGQCWIWLGYREKKMGYGQFYVRNRITVAHRYAYSMFIGEIPKGKIVCHHCDNPSCVRPSHLFVGTQADNIKDCCQKGRQARGESQGTAKLTTAEVKKIRSLYIFGSRTRGTFALARKFKVCQRDIWLIVNNRIWCHV